MQYFAETYTSCRSQCTPFICLCHFYTAIKTGQDKTKRPWNINIWLYNRVYNFHNTFCTLNFDHVLTNNCSSVTRAGNRSHCAHGDSTCVGARFSGGNTSHGIGAAGLRSNSIAVFEEVVCYACSGTCSGTCYRYTCATFNCSIRWRHRQCWCLRNHWNQKQIICYWDKLACWHLFIF